MPKNVQMPDGKVVEFPDNMTDAEVSNAIRTSSRPQIAQPKPPLSKVISPSEIGKGFIHTIPDMIMHPLQTIGATEFKNPAHPLEGYKDPDQFTQMAQGFKENPGYAIGGLASQLALGGALKGIGRVAPIAGEAIRGAAIGDPDVAALRVLRVPAGSPKSLRTISAVQGARPFLQGAQSLEDVQAKIPAAKEEIWGPYKKTIDAISDKKVQGPNGPTTVGELESDRLQTSALNRALKQRSPEAIQLAQQKGMTQAQLLEHEQAIKSALDPHLQQAGIDPQAIRQAFGQVSQIGERVSGRSTLAEPKQPFGFSKIQDLSLTKPLSNIGTIGSAGRDIAAGRYFSAKPTDVALREAFRTGGPKPDFRAPISAKPNVIPPLQLPASTVTNAQFRMGGGPTTLEATEGQQGIPHLERPIRQGQIPAPQAALPAIAGEGEAQPMLRYGKPYIEPLESTSIRTMPPQQHLQLPTQASPGEMRPYIAYRPAPPPGEITRIVPTRPERLQMQGQPLPSMGGIRGHLSAPPVATPSPEPTTAHIYPAGSAFRNQPMETPIYPPGSAFRPKIAPFDIDAYLRGLQ